MIRAWRDSIGAYGGMGLLRRDRSGGTYIADHIVVRALCLREPQVYEFRDGILNLFYIDRRLHPHENMLTQVRILEVLLNTTIIEIDSLCELLRGLRYSDSSISQSLTRLRGARLIGVEPENTVLFPPENGAIAFIRYRGSFYYRHLMTRLSYIQMVYFMSLIPKGLAFRFSYPQPPQVRNHELDRVVECFIETLKADVLRERSAADPAWVKRYEQTYCSLQDVVEKLEATYSDLWKIWRSIGGK
jgi:DNA-binding transcriptional ArsR family regulator